jgi:hypothetical protein
VCTYGIPPPSESVILLLGRSTFPNPLAADPNELPRGEVEEEEEEEGSGGWCCSVQIRRFIDLRCSGRPKAGQELANVSLQPESTLGSAGARSLSVRTGADRSREPIIRRSIGECEVSEPRMNLKLWRGVRGGAVGAPPRRGSPPEIGKRWE